jgi:probable F420-dependent oxidoreductase
MKFGLPLLGLNPRYFPEVAQVAEDNGFESVWMPEHLILPAEMPPTYPYSETGYAAINGDTPMYDPWIVLAAVAQATERIRLANNIYVVPLRHPFVTARAVVTLDWISRGRVTLGAGVGWLEEEFDAAGLDFATRGRRMEECIEVIRRLWTEDVITHHGEFFSFSDMKFQPKPTQKPTIPIEIGAHGGPALRRAGRIGDGWVEVGSKNFDTFTKRLEIVMAARREAQRVGPFEVTIHLGSSLDDIRRFEELGVTRMIVGPRSDPNFKPADTTRLRKEDFTDWLKRYGDAVISNA